MRIDDAVSQGVSRPAPKPRPKQAVSQQRQQLMRSATKPKPKTAKKPSVQQMLAPDAATKRLLELTVDPATGQMRAGAGGGKVLGTMAASLANRPGKAGASSYLTLASTGLPMASISDSARKNASAYLKKLANSGIDLSSVPRVDLLDAGERDSIRSLLKQRGTDPGHDATDAQLLTATKKHKLGNLDILKNIPSSAANALVGLPVGAWGAGQATGSLVFNHDPAALKAMGGGLVDYYSAIKRHPLGALQRDPVGTISALMPAKTIIGGGGAKVVAAGAFGKGAKAAASAVRKDLPLTAIKTVDGAPAPLIKAAGMPVLRSNLIDRAAQRTFEGVTSRSGPVQRYRLKKQVIREASMAKADTYQIRDQMLRGLQEARRGSSVEERRSIVAYAQGETPSRLADYYDTLVRKEPNSPHTKTRKAQVRIWRSVAAKTGDDPTPRVAAYLEALKVPLAKREQIMTSIGKVPEEQIAARRGIVSNEVQRVLEGRPDPVIEKVAPSNLDLERVAAEARRVADPKDRFTGDYFLTPEGNLGVITQSLFGGSTRKGAPSRSLLKAKVADKKGNLVDVQVTGSDLAAGKARYRATTAPKLTRVGSGDSRDVTFAKGDNADPQTANVHPVANGAVRVGVAKVVENAGLHGGEGSHYGFLERWRVILGDNQAVPKSFRTREEAVVFGKNINKALARGDSPRDALRFAENPPSATEAIRDVPPSPFADQAQYVPHIDTTPQYGNFLVKRGLNPEKRLAKSAKKNELVLFKRGSWQPDSRILESSLAQASNVEQMRNTLIRNIDDYGAVGKPGAPYEGTLLRIAANGQRRVMQPGEAAPALSQMLKEMHLQNEGASEADLIAQLEQKIIAKPRSNRIPEDGATYIVVPKQVGDQLTSEFGAHRRGATARAASTATDAWRYGTLFARPAWLAANMVSNPIQSAIGMADSPGGLARIPMAYARTMSGHRIPGTNLHFPGRDYSAAVPGTVRDAGWFNDLTQIQHAGANADTPLGRTLLGIANSAEARAVRKYLGAGPRAIVKVNQWTENVVREATYLHQAVPAAKKAVEGTRYAKVTDEVMAHLENNEIPKAAELVRDTLGDMRQKNRPNTRLVAPFYKWLMFASKLSLVTLPVKMPIRNELLQALGREGMKEINAIGGPAIGFQQGSIPFDSETRTAADGSPHQFAKMAATRNINTLGTVAEFLKTNDAGMPTIAGALSYGNPLASAALSSAFGRDLESGYAFKDADGNDLQPLTGGFSQFFKTLVNQEARTLPFVNLLDDPSGKPADALPFTANSKEFTGLRQPKRSKAAKIAAYLTGVNVREADLTLYNVQWMYHFLDPKHNKDLPPDLEKQIRKKLNAMRGGSGPYHQQLLRDKKAKDGAAAKPVSVTVPTYTTPTYETPTYEQPTYQVGP